jgi:hypothetical protein
VNGRPTALYPTNLAFQGLPLGSGRQAVVLEYVPTPAYVAFGISALSWVLWAGALFVGWNKDKSPS